MSGEDEKTPNEQRKHQRSPVRLIVEYEDADDFIGDYTENLSTGGTFIHTARVLERDTTIQLVLSFPGLLQPIALDGVVRWSRGGKQPGIGIEFLPGGERDKLDGIIGLIQNRDPRTVARVVRVLVAEDNPHMTELICTGLGASARRMFGDAFVFYFATAEDGGQALELLQKNAFDIAIIDVYLPVVDGAKVIGRVRELGLTELPIIAIAGADERSSAIRAGANLFLSKPMQLRDMLESMRRLVMPAS